MEFTCAALPDAFGFDAVCWGAAIYVLVVAETTLTGLGITYEGEQQLEEPPFSIFLPYY